MGKAKNRTGFTLAEVMVVMLVITILFAVFAPFMTKRRSSSLNKENLWSTVSRNYFSGPMDVYFEPASSGGVFIGTTPDSENDIKSSYTPLSRLTIRSGYIADNAIQRQLQLRYGRANYEDPGQLAAAFLADGTNLLFGANYSNLSKKNSDATYPSRNVAFGYNSMNSIVDNNDSSKKAERNTAFGTNSLTNTLKGMDNTAIGSNSGSGNYTGSGNTFVGYNAGSNTTKSFNTLLGFNSQASDGSYNTFIGAGTGNNDLEHGDYSYNVAVGYDALHKITSGKYNVAVGSGALSNLTTGDYNVAIGYNACSNIVGQSYKTCIGANSGPTANTPVNTDLALKSTDLSLRTYIGENPNRSTRGNNFGGDAVMEIHNVNTNNEMLINSPNIKSNTTTIINGNLIVRGKTFFTMGNILYPFYYSNNIFGTNSSVSCADNQFTYNFSNTGNCSTLNPITGVATSDRRLKNIKSKNISGLEKIKNLKVYNYIFKDDPAKEKHVGVIAQDLQKIFPNSVYKDNNGYLKITTDEIFYAIINSINELNKKLESYISKAAALDKDLNKMEDENKKLQQQVDELTLHIEKLKKKH